MSEVTYFILYILQHNKGRHQPFWSDPLNPIFRLSLIFLSGDAPFSPYAGVTLACAGRGRKLICNPLVADYSLQAAQAVTLTSGSRIVHGTAQLAWCLNREHSL